MKRAYRADAEIGRSINNSWKSFGCERMETLFEQTGDNYRTMPAAGPRFASRNSIAI